MINILASRKRRQRHEKAQDRLMRYPSTIDDDLWPAFKHTLIESTLAAALIVLATDNVTDEVIKLCCRYLILSPMPEGMKADTIITIKDMAREGLLY